MRGRVKLSRLCCFHMMSWWPHWCTKTMKGDHVGDHYVCGIDLFFSAKRLVSFFSKEVDYPLSIVHNKINLSCPIWQISQVQCEPVHGTLHYTASSFSLMCLVLCSEHSCRTKLEINPWSPNGDQDQFSRNNTGLKITAGQRTMIGLIVGLTGQTLVWPVILTGHFWMRTFYNIFHIVVA